MVVKILLNTFILETVNLNCFTKTIPKTKYLNYLKALGTCILILILPFSLLAKGKKSYVDSSNDNTVTGSSGTQHSTKHQSGKSSGDFFVSYLSLPYAHQKSIYQDIFINLSKEKPTNIIVTCFDITKPADSTEVFAVKAKLDKPRRGKLYSTLRLDDSKDSSRFQSVYKHIILQNGKLPAGNYRSIVRIRYKDTTITTSFTQTVDSMLSMSSSAHRAFDDVYSSQGEKSVLGISYNRVKAPISNNPQLSVKKLSKQVDGRFRKKGFSVRYRDLGEKTIADVFCRDRYVGYYEINHKEPLAESIKKRQARLSGNLSGGVNTNINNDKPIFAQLKELKNAKTRKEGKGNISITGNMASGQEENSAQENNFYEIAGELEAPIKNIPVTIEGYYTSQDQNRNAKASYIRLHYDAAEAKSGLLQMITGYNHKYKDASQQAGSYKNIYGTYLNNMQGEKDKLWSEVLANSAVPDAGRFKADTSGLYAAMTAAAIDKAGGKAEAAQTAKADYDKAIEKYQRIQELEKKIRHYNQLLTQYNENLRLDSMIAYDKLKDIDDGAEDMSYRRLAKSAQSLMPPGENKTALAGLTHLDIGIFSKQVSAYTINGQTIKGVDIGYDWGLFETAVTYGRIEYVSRDGTLDRYNGYSGRLRFRPGKKQQTSLIYYGYSPSGRMLREDGFFKNMDAHMPSFKNPINIVSVMHEGIVNKYVSMEAEAATSFRTADDVRTNNVQLSDRMSYRVQAIGQIPHTAIDLRAGYEHAGKHFENNTLPLNLSGTQRYNAAANGQFFKSFLTLGVEYNYILQQNFAGKSANSKWGFDIKTTSRRYPSASLSYKPFTTFRTIADTFNIPQRPVVGEVWTGKLTYQIKNKIASFRMTAIYNRNSATVDTNQSRSTIAQLNLIYTRGKTNLMLNAGRTQVQASSLSPVHLPTNFLTVAAGYIFNKQWNVSAGQDIGMTKAGLSRYAANIGAGYCFKKLPLAIRTGFRYNRYKLTEGGGWKQLYAGMLDMNWQFRFKMKEKA